MINIFSIEGRMNRKDFFFTFLAITTFWLIVGYILSIWLPPTKGDAFFISRFLVEILGLLSVTPIMLRRLHDISLPGYVLIVLWLAIPFSLRNIVYLNQYFKTDFLVTSKISLILSVLGLILFVMLFLYKSFTKDNKWGKFIKT